MGPPEKLVYDEMPPPPMGPKDVRIKVKAAGVNFPDSLIIQGKYQFKAPLPFSPGSEVSGTVMEVGAEVGSFKPGDEVMAMLTHGGYAEQAVTPAEKVLPIPPGLDPTAAAGFMLVYGTSYYALKQRGNLKPGETLLVLGAAGGVGLSAVQLGKLMGARVIAGASDQAKLDLCKREGADELINYSTDSLKESVKKLTNGQGADVIYDPVGGALAQECMSAINWNGRYLVIGFPAGIPEIATNRLLLKSAAAIGVFWGAHVVREPKAHAENFREMYAWIAAGKLKPVVSKVYPLSQGAQALRDMLERKVTGKVVLVP
ncbi:MAG: NADPH:quinone oxidoreductase family protein [Nevskia sp.]|nr:NADPH:quinone oxidoreductase family protein [Nevskia sp.]